MKVIRLPQREAVRLFGLTLRPGVLLTRARFGSSAIRCESMTTLKGSPGFPIRDSIQLVIERRHDRATIQVPSGPQDITKIQVLLHTPLGLGTATETIDRSIDNRVLAKIVSPRSFTSAKSALHLGHILNDRLLATTRNIRGCTVHISCVPSWVPTENSPIDLRAKKFSVRTRPLFKAVHENDPGTVTQQLEVSETGWYMTLVLGLLSDGYKVNSPIYLDIVFQREYKETTISGSTPDFTEPERNAPSPQAPSFAAVPDRGALDFDIHEQLARLAKATRFSTAEALASHLADKAYAIADAKYPKNGFTSVVVRIHRPIAGEGVGQASVTIVRDRSDLSHRPDEQLASLRAQGKYRVIVALGANIGDRIGNIEEACREMDRRDIRVVRTSLLYETEAMYVVNQDPFINGACEVSENLIIKSTFTSIKILCLRAGQLEHCITRRLKSDGCHSVG